MKKTILFLLILLLGLSACNSTGSTATSEPATTQTAGSSLTAEMLQNAEYILVSPDGTATAYRLTDGAFRQGLDATQPDYMALVLGEQIAFGDLNGDGVQDAAVLLGENYAGTGVYVSLAAVLNQDGTPLHISSAFIDDRPVVSTLVIQDGTIILDEFIHSINDAMCCPSEPVQEYYRLEGRRLILTRFVAHTAGGLERSITIESPLAGAQVGAVITLKGRVSMAPFENNLVVRVYNAAGDQIYSEAMMVSAAEMGAPGTFDTRIELSAAGLTPGPIRLEILDVSMADGSTLALDSVSLVYKK